VFVRGEEVFDRVVNEPESVRMIYRLAPAPLVILVVGPDQAAALDVEFEVRPQRQLIPVIDRNDATVPLSEAVGFMFGRHDIVRFVAKGDGVKS
jgi:hypothetical protein